MFKVKYPHLKSLRAFYRPYRLKIALYVFFAILGGALALVFPFVTSQLIIHLTGGGGDWDRMIVFALLVFGLVTVESIITVLTNIMYSKVTNNLFLNIRKTAIDKTMSMNMTAVYEKGTGFFMERLGEDSSAAGMVLLDLYKLVITIVFNLGFIAYITVINPLLGAAFGVGLVVLIFLSYFRVSRLLANTKKQKRAREAIKSTETEILKGLKEVKGIGARNAILAKHSGVSGNFINIKRNREKFSRAMEIAITVTKALTDLTVLLVAGLYLLPNDMVELAAVLVIYNYKGNIYNLVHSLAVVKDTFVNGELAAGRINDIIMAKPDETDNFGDTVLTEAVGSIEFKNIKFGYSDDKQILKGINLKIDRPGVYGFVGKSGSGKSTMFSLLTNFYKPTAGEIKVNGVPLSDLTEDSVRNNITPVLQDPYMFNDTVINNIRFARPDATDDMVAAACKSARIHDEIMAMRDGYNTVIGENGATVSGGQKQRLEIARAILKDTPVMLFDEATSALDKTNLNHINDLLIELGKEKIIFVIAHRLGVMRRCSQVVVLDDGLLAAVGEHGKLIETCPMYAELFKRSAAAEQKV